VSILRFEVERVLADADLDTAIGRDKALEEAQPLIAASPAGSAEREELVRLVADRVDVSPHAVMEAASTARPRPTPTAAPAPSSGDPGPERPPSGAAAGSAARPSPGSQSLAAERSFLAMCLAAGELGRDYLERLRPGHFSSDAGRRARDHLAGSFEDPLAGLSQEDPAVEALVTGAAMGALDQQGISESVLRMDFLQLELRRVERELRRAGEQGDWSKQNELARAKQDVRTELDSVMGQTA
jgi:DNA primase